MYEEKQKFNRLKREEVVPRYKSISPPYYQENHENEEFEQKAQNFEPSICYMVKQKVAIRGIRMSRAIESILVIKQETVVLPRVKPIVAKGVSMAIKVRYSEPILNQ
jgi:hypothetical protein